MFADAGDLRGVVIEITEQTAVACYDALVTALAPARAAGALLAVDDAGAGFASLKHITVLRPDFVKVDRDLIAGIDTDETKAAVVEALGMFTSRLDAWLIAEGVETIAELDRLLSLRVPLVQGYGLGRPRPAWVPPDPRRSHCAGDAGPSPPTGALRPRRTSPARRRDRGRLGRVRHEPGAHVGRRRRRVRPAGRHRRSVRRRHVRRSACCRRNGWPTWPGASRPARPPTARPRWRCATNARGSSGW